MEELRGNQRLTNERRRFNARLRGGGDNNSNGFTTSCWGPALWHYWHIISRNYIPDRKQVYIDFLKGLLGTLPCKACRDNLPQRLSGVGYNIDEHSKNDCYTSRDAYTRFVFAVHDAVNTALHKSTTTTFPSDYDKRVAYYEQFRAKTCSAIEEVACRGPLNVRLTIGGEVDNRTLLCAGAKKRKIKPPADEGEQPRKRPRVEVIVISDEEDSDEEDSDEGDSDEGDSEVIVIGDEDSDDEDSDEEDSEVIVIGDEDSDEGDSEVIVIGDEDSDEGDPDDKESSSSEEDSSEEEAGGKGSSSRRPPPFDVEAARFLVRYYDAYKDKSLKTRTLTQYTNYLKGFQRYIKEHGDGVVREIANRIPTHEELQDYKSRDIERYTLPATLIKGDTNVVMEDTTGVEKGQYVFGDNILYYTTVVSVTANTSIVLSMATGGAGAADLTFSHDDDAEFYPTDWRKQEAITLYSNILSKIKQANKTCLGRECTRQIPYNQEDGFCAKCRTNMEKVPNAKAAYFTRFQTDLDEFKRTFIPPGGPSSGITFGEHIEDSPFIKYLKKGRGLKGRYLAQRSNGTFIDLTLPNNTLQQTLSADEFGRVETRTMESEYEKKLQQRHDMLAVWGEVYMLVKAWPGRVSSSDTYYTWHDDRGEDDKKKRDYLFIHNEAFRDTILDLSNIHTLQWRDNENNKSNVLNQEVPHNECENVDLYDKLNKTGGGFKLKNERMVVSVSENGIFKIVQTHRRRGKTWALCRKGGEDYIGTKIETIGKEYKATTNNGTNRFEIKLKAYDKEGTEQRFKPFTFIGKNISSDPLKHDSVFDHFEEFEWVPTILPDGGYGVREW